MAVASAVVAAAVLMVAAMLVVIRVGNICNTKRIMTMQKHRFPKCASK